MRKYCYNELQPGVRIKMNTGIAGKQEHVYNRSCKEEQGQEQLQWLSGAPWWGRGLQIAEKFRRSLRKNLLWSW